MKEAVSGDSPLISLLDSEFTVKISYSSNVLLINIQCSPVSANRFLGVPEYLFLSARDNRAVLQDLLSLP